jgi:predicted enzyme related to lactoylglutathione lyase
MPRAAAWILKEKLMAILNLALTKIVVADVEAQERFYTQALGLTRTAYIEQGEGEAHIREAILGVAGAQLGMAQLSLVQYVGRAAPPPGEAIIAFMSNDLEATIAAMVEAGGQIVVPVQEVPEHGLKLAFVIDPEGHTVEILQTL